MALVRTLFYTIDPYGLRMIVPPPVNRILYNVFYSLCLISYCIMLLQWIEICHPTSQIIDGKYINYYKIASIAIVCIFVILEIIISILNAQVLTIFFYIYYGFIGLVIVGFFEFEF